MADTTPVAGVGRFFVQVLGATVLRFPDFMTVVLPPGKLHMFVAVCLSEPSVLFGSPEAPFTLLKTMAAMYTHGHVIGSKGEALAALADFVAAAVKHWAACPRSCARATLLRLRRLSHEVLEDSDGFDSRCRIYVGKIVRDVETLEGAFKGLLTFPLGCTVLCTE